MPRSVRSGTRTSYGEPVFTWAFRSSQPRGGQIILYETRLEENGTIRCNCPGWIFSKGEPTSKTCKHKKEIEAEAPDILRRFRAGEALPMLDPGLPEARPARRSRTTTRPARQATAVEPEAEHTKARYGRVIEI